MNIETYLFNDGRIISYRGSGNIECPACGISIDAGTGEHSIPDTTICNECQTEIVYSPDGTTVVN